MKAVWFAAADGVRRVAVAFDPRRHGIPRVADDKSGVNEGRLYRRLITGPTSVTRRLWNGGAAHVRRKGSRHEPNTGGPNTGRKNPGRHARYPAEGKLRARRYRVSGPQGGGRESLRALRQVAGKAQTDIAAALHIKQPSVSKIEESSGYVSLDPAQLRRRHGGELELIVRLPSRPAILLRRLGDVFHTQPGATRPRTTRSGPTKRASART